MSSVKDRPQSALILLIQKVILISTLLWTLNQTWTLDPWSISSQLILVLILIENGVLIVICFFLFCDQTKFDNQRTLFICLNYYHLDCSSLDFYYQHILLSSLEVQQELIV